MDEAVLVADPAVADLLNPVPAQRARLLLAQGNVTAAAEWIAAAGLGPDDEPSYPREPAYLVLTRILLTQGRTGQALGLLDKLHATATAQGRTGSVIEIQVLRALVLEARGEDTAAVAALTKALNLARQQGYLRVFVDEGAAMGALFGRLITTRHAERAALPADYLRRLVEAFEERDKATHGSPNATSALASRLAGPPLSYRELEVLRRVAIGMQNQEIAAELFIAVSTVKKHLTHILEKLGAANRTEATARARIVDLLD